MKVLLIAIVLGALVAPASAQGVYGLGVTAEYGNAYLPPTGGAGFTTMLRYREIGGVLGGILLVVGSTPIKPSPSTRTENKYECTGQGAARSCLSWSETTTTYPSSAEVAEFERKVAAWDPAIGEAIMRGELGQELDIQIPLRALGGNTSGFMMKMWRPVGDSRYFSLGQYAFGWLTFHDVHSRVVSAANQELRSMEKVADFTYKYVGLPIRFQAPLGHTGVGVHFELDLNALAIVMDQPSPMRGGVQWAGHHVLVMVEGVVTGFRPDGASLAGEVMLAF